MGLFDIFKVSQYKAEIDRLNTKLQSLGADEYIEVRQKTDDLYKEIADNSIKLNKLQEEVSDLQTKDEKLTKQINTNQKKLVRLKELYKSVKYSIDEFIDNDVKNRLSFEDETNYDDMVPSVILKLHHMDVKDLRKAFRENEKQIDELTVRYKKRYTTKTNKTIYQLMVIALRAELQNILFQMKYEKLDTAIEQVKLVTAKYLQIASEGNQSIAGTLTSFIGELEYLFINAVKIEYNYYVKKEQAKQEQMAIREQMRQEAEERKALEKEKKKIEQEEQKYNSEIEKLNEQITTANDDELSILQARILELQSQLSDIVLKKDEISNLQNGKAGNVYIISNLGSFGENMFKIGMTRRLDPQDRVNELGDASVPFKFDVHSFIFSEDAVSLESRLHQMMDSKRVNKVNRRKEFFYSTIDELEQLVSEVDPSAEFNRTMIADEFRQSISTDEVYSDDFTNEDFEDEDE